MAIDAVEFKNFMGEEDVTAAWVYTMWSSWDQQRSVWKDRMDEVNQYLMATDTSTTTNNKNGFNHSTHRPKLTQIYDNLIANYKPGVIPNRNWVKWDGEDKSAVTKENRSLLEGYVRTKHRLSDFDSVVDLLLDDWVRTGNCFAGVEFINQQHEDSKGRIRRGYKGPRVYRIDPLDIVFNPFATSFYNAPKIVRSVFGIGDLVRKSEELSGQEKELFDSTLERIKAERAWMMKQGKGSLTLQGEGHEEIRKYIQATWDGFGNYVNYMMSGSVEILEFYGDIYDSTRDMFMPNRKISIVDRRYVILNEPIDTWNGKPHIYHCGWRTRPNNLWGQGPLEKLVGLQFRIDHLENARADAFDEMLDSDKVIKGNVEEEFTESGSVEYHIPDMEGDVSRLPPDKTVLQADLQIQELEAAMDLYAGSPREAMGFRTPGEKTKFEVSQLMNAAGRIFQHKLERFEVQMLEKILNAEIEVARRASDYADTIEILDPSTGAKNFKEVTSEDLYLNGKYVPIGARHYSRQQQLAQDARDLFTLLTEDPEMLDHFPSKKLAKLFEELMGFDEHDLFQEFGRIYERADKARLTATTQQQLMQEDATSLLEPLNEGEEDAQGVTDITAQVQNAVQGQGSPGAS